MSSSYYGIFLNHIYVQCASNCFPIFNVFIDWRLSFHVRKILFYLFPPSELNMTDSLWNFRMDYTINMVKIDSIVLGDLFGVKNTNKLLIYIHIYSNIEHYINKDYKVMYKVINIIVKT